jgi:hypothetical protein
MFQGSIFRYFPCKRFWDPFWRFFFQDALGVSYDALRFRRRPSGPGSVGEGSADQRSGSPRDWKP